jgi:hypothetical protein
MPLSLWPHCHGTTNKELQRDIEQRGCCGLMRETILTVDNGALHRRGAREVISANRPGHS